MDCEEGGVGGGEDWIEDIELLRAGGMEVAGEGWRWYASRGLWLSRKRGSELCGSGSCEGAAEEKGRHSGMNYSEEGSSAGQSRRCSIDAVKQGCG